MGGGATRLITDVREAEASLARPVPVGPGLTATLPRRFSDAMVWPRAHLGKDFARQCLARGARGLAEGGRLWCAVRKDKGADTVADFMAALMGDVTVERRDKRYRLLRSDRGARLDEALAERTLGVRYRLEDPWLGDLVVRACPGVFSRRELDAGTRVLIEHAAHMELEPVRIVDLGAGVGPLALWAAKRWPGAHVTAVESNVIAATMCRENAESSGLSGRVEVVVHDGLPAPASGVELALVNPPTHADAAELGRLLGGLRAWLQPGAPALAVVNRPGRAHEAFAGAGATVRRHPYAHYTVLDARW